MTPRSWRRPRDGSEVAFRTLYRAYVRPVYWLAHGLVGNAADAEDVTQETFLVAWRKLPGLRAGGRLAAAVARDDLPLPGGEPHPASAARPRAHGRPQPTRRLPATVDVEQQVIDGELADRILREVAGLSPLDRDIFRLCAAEGYAYQAAAEELGVAHGVVRNRLSRIRTRLRTVVKEST